MAKRMPVFMQRESLSRLGVALLLAAGYALPLLMAFGLESQLASAGLLMAGLLAVLTMLTATRKARWVLWGLTAALCGAQAFLPNAGLLGGCMDAVKALALYFQGTTAALALFGAQAALLIAAATALMGFLFARRGVGFLPAALVTVLMLFALWSLGKANLFWWAAPALVGLLLLQAQNAHEKINLLHVLPMALAAVLAAFLLLPQGNIALEPVHTQAMDLKQRIEDYLFFTEPRNVFTLGSYGYYPMGGNRLGGEAEPSEYPVMIVQTGRKTLMRAVSKDEYTGRSFRDTSSARRYLYVSPRWLAQRQKAFLENLPSEAIRGVSTLLDQKAINVQMQNRAASTVFTPLFVRSLSMQSDMVPYFNDASELFITRDLDAEDRYTIYAPVFEGGDNGLEALVNAARRTDDTYQSLYAQYTQLPDHMEQQVYADVKNIVADSATPYAQAMAIQRHLQKYYRYTLAPDTPPENQDFVTYFLYKGREGYCTYFASAMTVMCRMAGLPARYVEGFLAQPGGDGLAYVTGKDAHAWTEVYFEGFGWVPFDPTPTQQTGNETPPQQDESNPEPSPSPEPDEQPTPTPDPNQPDDQPTPEPNPSDSPEPQQDSPTEEPDSSDDPFQFPWWILLVLAALGGLVARVALRMPDRVAARQKTENDKIFIYGAATATLLRLKKRTPRPGETPLAFARRMDSLKATPAPIYPLWRILTLSRYSRMEPGENQTARARETFVRAYGSQRLPAKLRFWLAAAFSRKCYASLDTPLAADAPAPTVQPPQKPGKGPKKPKGKGPRKPKGKPPKGGGKPAKRAEPPKAEPAAKADAAPRQPWNDEDPIRVSPRRPLPRSAQAPGAAKPPQGAPRKPGAKGANPFARTPGRPRAPLTTVRPAQPGTPTNPAGAPAPAQPRPQTPRPGTPSRPAVPAPRRAPNPSAGPAAPSGAQPPLSPDAPPIRPDAQARPNPQGAPRRPAPPPRRP